jgi:uncharacterized iron-regulated protein
MLLVIVTLLAGCSTETVVRRGVHERGSDPLVGRIYREGDVVPTDFAVLLESMKSSTVVYLGETHDNASHHHIEQQVINQLTAQGLRPALGFEFFSREQTSHLLRYRNAGKPGRGGQGHSGAAASEQLLRAQLGWGSNRDRDWNRFLPILRKARELQLPVFGADLPAALRVNLARHGYDGLNGVEKLVATRSGFDDPVYRDWMLERLKAAHCGWGDAAYLGRLYETWLARNEAMAEAIVAMVKNHPGQPVVVILGGGHIEHNMGVYERVEHLLPGIRQLNIRMLQVGREPKAAAAYFTSLVRDGRDYGPVHEYLWFTSGTARQEDECDEFKTPTRHRRQAERDT